MSDEKLQKVLARAGLGSRRVMEQAIADGKVQVNGQVAKLGDRVSATDKVVFQGRNVKIEAPDSQALRVLLYNKPEGEICTRKDEEGRRTVFESLPRLKQGRWINIGRLDINTTGALLFTNDGDFAHKLMHPSSVIDREYLVRVFGEIDDELPKRLCEGVLLEDGMARFSDVKAHKSEGRNHWYYCAVMEGRNREVRRLWESQDLKVSRLKRVRYANIFLPSHLRMGQWTELTSKEISELAATAGYDIPANAKPFTPQEKKDHQRRQQKLRRKRAPR